jgi:hypothetical protein
MTLDCRMKIEDLLVTVLFPPLRCPKCRGPVRQFPHELDGTDFAIILSIESFGCVVFGVGVFVGFLWQAIWLFVGITAIPLSWVYVRHLRRVEYSCIQCKGVFSYAAVRRAAI